MRDRALRLGQLIVSLALVGLLIAGIGTDTLDALRAVPAPIFIAALGLFTCAQLWCAWRLYILLERRTDAAPFGRVLRLTLIGYFASNLLPGTIGGDFVKGVALARAGVETKLTVAALLVDRAVNVLALLALAAASCAASRISAIVPDWALGCLVAGLCAAVAAWMMRRHLGRGASALISRLSARLQAIGGELIRALAGFAHERARLLAAFVLSLASLGSAIVAQFMVAQALGIDIGIVALAAIICLVTLAAMVPISLNGIGLQEIGFVYLLSALGAPESGAIAFALLSRVLILGTSIIGGAIFARERFAPQARPTR